MDDLIEAATPLKLIALDADDLDVVSALVQDAITRSSEMRYLHEENAFVLVVDRLARELRPERYGPLGLRKRWQRRRAMLDLRRVTRVQRQGLAQGASRANEEPLVLLAATFEAAGADQPGGTIELAFAGGATLRLDVEVVEARLTDLGPAWKSAATPRHAA